LPRHVAVIMDGNRRWARNRGLPSALGHAAGAKRVKGIVQSCADLGIPHLTLFAFSTENWKRPETEVSALMGLLGLYLQKEVGDMHAKGVRLKMVGDLSKFDTRIQALIRDAEAHTAANTRITLTVAINYGGRWDCLQAVQAWQAHNPQAPLREATEEAVQPFLAMAHAPDPDLLIRTGGERRISNFMLWQLAYTELYFSDTLWPAFDEQELTTAIDFYRNRDRRFGGSSFPTAANG
jgi:undecaprenyl diphosphate synthase